MQLHNRILLGLPTGAWLGVSANLTLGDAPGLERLVSDVADHLRLERAGELPSAEMAAA